MRHVATVLFLLLLGSCSSLSSEEQEQLAEYQRNAKEYFENGRLQNALAVIDRGLLLDPDDYQLRTLRGAILVQTSLPSDGFDHRQLDQATELLGGMFDERSLQTHSRAYLFHYALCLQKQARRNIFEANRREERAKGGGAGAPTPEQIAALRKRGAEDYAAARELLEELIRRGEITRLCHKQLLLAACDRNDDAGVRGHAAEYFRLVQEAQEFHLAEIAKTNVIEWENVQKENLAAMRSEEVQMRALLAQYHTVHDDLETALVMMNRLLELEPDRSVDYYNRACLHMRLGQDPAARADFERFLKTTDLPSTNEKFRFAGQYLVK